MKKLAIGNRLTVILLITCIGLGALLKQQSESIIETQQSSSPDAAQGIDPLARSHFSAPSVAAFREINERPLFLVDRRPPPKPKPKAREVVRLMPLRLQLSGVVLSPWEKVAVMLDLSTNEVLHLTVGMQHQGWELSEIGGNVATFKRGAQTQQLEMVQ